MIFETFLQERKSSRARPSPDLLQRPIIDPESVKAFPRDLRMIAGDSTATNPQSKHVTAWRCTRTYKTILLQEPPRECPEGRRLALVRIFPELLERGQRNLDSPDHQSHMAYSKRQTVPRYAPCSDTRDRLEYHLPDVERGGDHLVVRIALHGARGLHQQLATEGVGEPS